MVEDGGLDSAHSFFFFFDTFSFGLWEYRVAAKIFTCSYRIRDFLFSGA